MVRTRIRTLALHALGYLLALFAGGVLALTLVGTRQLPVPAPIPVAIPDNAVVLPAQVPSLLISREELPVDMALKSFSLNDEGSIPFISSMSSRSSWSNNYSTWLRAYGMEWQGSPVTVGRSSGVQILCYLFGSAIEAERWSTSSNTRVSADASATSPVGAVSDHFWQQTDRLLFQRRNVVVQVIRYGDAQQLTDAHLQQIAVRIGQKINAALAMRPEATPALPLSARELAIDEKTAWARREITAGPLGADTEALVVRVGDSLPRTVPAKALGGDDYLVPATHLTALMPMVYALSSAPPVSAQKDGTYQVWLERFYTLTPGKTAVTLGSHVLHLAHAPEMVKDTLVLPLSALRTLQGWTITRQGREMVLTPQEQAPAGSSNTRG